MSKDNGIYILQLKNECRVLHAKNIENVLMDKTNPWCGPFVADWLVEYFEKAPVYGCITDAVAAAAELSDTAGALEHGMKLLLDLSHTWEEYENMAEEDS
ncbi:MAG: hypothetical protein IJN92_08660 [Lachnospiraceae bacterium]|nr:hypothetical protein [Lachnospiraceae bacterium]